MNWKQLLTKPLTHFFKKEKKANQTKKVGFGSPKAMPPVKPPDNPKSNEPLSHAFHIRPGADLVPKHKFSEPYKHRLAMHIAECDGPSEVAKIVKAETGLDVTRSTIDYYTKHKRWGPLIEKKRQTYLQNVQDVPGFHERVRLERADKIYKYAIENGQHDLALKATEQQRKEVKERAVNVNLTQYNQYNNLTDEEVQEKLRESMARLGKLMNGTKEVTIGPDRTTEKDSQ